MASAPVDIPRMKTSKGAGIPVDMAPSECGFSADGIVNPEPLAHDAVQDLMLEEYLSPRRLRELTGVENLEEVEYLELRVDTSETTLGNFGILVPNLKHLKLTGSSIQSVRDLGSSLDNLQSLWMATTGLHDIDGLSSMCNLRELYLAFNEISDLSPCSMLDDLRILDLEGNQLDDISQVEFLSLCTKLADVTLRGNPFCDKMTVEEYRQKIFSILPCLKNLDDKDLADPEFSSSCKGSSPNKPPIKTTSSQNPVLSTPKTPPEQQKPKESAPTLAKQVSASNPFTDDWNLINQFVREGTIGTDSVLTDSGYSSLTSPATTAATLSASGRSATARPRSARPLTAAASPFRPLTSLASTSSSRLGSSDSSRPTTSRGNVSSISPSPTSLVDDLTADSTSSSLLTKGPVICGNPSRALRRRREFATSAAGLQREGTNSSNRSSTTASPNNDNNRPNSSSSTSLQTVVGPENAATIAASFAHANERIGSVASLGEQHGGDVSVSALLQDIDKWRTEFQTSEVAKRIKEKNNAGADVLVVQQGVLSDESDDDEDDAELDDDSENDDREVTSPISPKPPSDPRPLVTRRMAAGHEAKNYSLEKTDRQVKPPTILAPPLPLPAIGATYRPITSSSNPPPPTTSGSRMSSKIQFVSAKPSQ